MAKATRTEQVVTKLAPMVRLELTPVEALTLRKLLGSIGGNPALSARIFLDPIVAVLNELNLGEIGKNFATYYLNPEIDPKPKDLEDALFVQWR